MQKLDAVNMCLRAASLSPVNSLDATGDPQVTRASAIVDDVSSQVQEAGWNANTDFKMTFAIDSEGKCPLPANVLNISAKDYNDNIRRVSARKDSSGVFYVWNVDDRTFVFEAPLVLDITYLDAFDDLPPRLQRYIAAEAACVYQAEYMQAATADKFCTRRAEKALMSLQDAEAEEEDCNILMDSPTVALIASRNSYIWPIR